MQFFICLSVILNTVINCSVLRVVFTNIKVFNFSCFKCGHPKLVFLRCASYICSFLNLSVSVVIISFRFCEGIFISFIESSSLFTNWTLFLNGKYCACHVCLIAIFHHLGQSFWLQGQKSMQCSYIYTSCDSFPSCH
jgi:hypothetical protein